LKFEARVDGNTAEPVPIPTVSALRLVCKRKMKMGSASHKAVGALRHIVGKKETSNAGARVTKEVVRKFAAGETNKVVGGGVSFKMCRVKSVLADGNIVKKQVLTLGESGIDWVVPDAIAADEVFAVETPKTTPNTKKTQVQIPFACQKRESALHDFANAFDE